jgi:hypothetical protein
MPLIEHFTDDDSKGLIRVCRPSVDRAFWAENNQSVFAGRSVRYTERIMQVLAWFKSTEHFSKKYMVV